MPDAEMSNSELKELLDQNNRTNQRILERCAEMTAVVEKIDEILIGIKIDIDRARELIG